MTTKPIKPIDLRALRRRLLAACEARPDLRRGLRAAIADIDRAIGQRPAASAVQRHNQTRVK